MLLLWCSVRDAHRRSYWATPPQHPMKALTAEARIQVRILLPAVFPACLRLNQARIRRGTRLAIKGSRETGL